MDDGGSVLNGFNILKFKINFTGIMQYLMFSSLSDWLCNPICVSSKFWLVYIQYFYIQYFWETKWHKLRIKLENMIKIYIKKCNVLHMELRNIWNKTNEHNITQIKLTLKLKVCVEYSAKRFVQTKMT